MATLSSRTTPARTYVSKTDKHGAQVSVGTTVRQEQESFFQETGQEAGDMIMPGTNVNADAMMSPTAGM